LTFIAATVLLLAAGGIWAYKASVPLDGLSPAWYPAPKGGADPAWEESYKKAAELVKQMTLIEKVNITTGTGWSMDMCVGNNGAVPRLNFPQLCLQVCSQTCPAAEILCANICCRTALSVFDLQTTSPPSPQASP
jgi:beta-glucosidase